MLPIPSDSATLAYAPFAATAPLANMQPHDAGLSPSSSPRSQKLRHATSEFESLLLTNLWKSMKSTFAAPDGEDDDSADPARDSLDDWGIRAMSQAVANAGGFGIGRLLFNHLQPLSASSDSPTASPLIPKTGIPPPAT